MTMTERRQPPRGLKGVVVADTELGDVRGLEGFYHYRQYSAARARRDAHLRGRVVPAVRGRAARRSPTRDALRRRDRGAARACPPTLVDAAARRSPRHDRARSPALRTALSQLAAVEGMPPDLRRRSRDHPRQRAPARRRDAGAHRRRCTARRSGSTPIAPRDDLGHRGELPLDARRRGARSATAPVPSSST